MCKSLTLDQELAFLSFLLKYEKKILRASLRVNCWSCPYMIVELVPSGNHPNHPIRNILLQNILLSSQYTMVFRIYTLYIVLYFAMMFYMHCKGLFLQVLEPSFYTFLSFTMKHSQSLISFSRGQFYNLQCSLYKQIMPPIIFPSLIL